MDEPKCVSCRMYKWERDQARRELAQSLTEEERWQIQRLRKEIREMQLAAERRNRELDAMSWVWCDGGCFGGVHRFDGKGPEGITQEIVDLAVRNTKRLQSWWANWQYRMERFPPTVNDTISTATTSDFNLLPDAPKKEQDARKTVESNPDGA